LPLGAESFDIKRWLREEALALGFHHVGFTSCEPFQVEAARRRAWLDGGGRELFPYLDHADSLEPARWLEGAKTALVGFFPYARPNAIPGHAPGSLKLSRYLWGPEYPGVKKGRLKLRLARAPERLPYLRGRVSAAAAPQL